MSKRAVLFMLLCIAAASGLLLYLHDASRRIERDSTAPTELTLPAPAPIANEPAPPEAVASSAPQDTESEQASTPSPDPTPPQAEQIFFRYNGVDAHYGKLAYMNFSNPNKVHFVDRLDCEVVHVSGGRGICLIADRGVFTTYAAKLFDADTFAVRATLPLNGIPSRSRVSVDGKLAALTVFVSGHGYTTLDFSTQTLLIDVEGGTVLADLEKDFEVSRGGTKFSNADFNFWGVTFTPDAKHFYATLSTDGKHFLIRGDIAKRTATVLHENVECPSVSPDGSRVAYKKRFIIDNRIVWQLHVLDVATLAETPLSERRSIDDQLEWLGNDRVLYSVPAKDGSSPSTEVWVAPADGSGVPKLFLPNAYSPAVARNAGKPTV